MENKVKYHLVKNCLYQLYHQKIFYPIFQKFDGDVNGVLASNEYNELREKFKTQKLVECSKCWEEEDNGVKSLREEFNEQYDCDEIKLRHLEIGFDNICNLKCDPCWEEWSY